jgi:hypothetical protein
LIGMGRDLVTRANKDARPVIVRQGALADNVPHRDLYLTHGHSLYVDGVLIPVENLVNHHSILWDEAAKVVEYYHIELEDHDVVLADGAAAESYYDAGNRARFQNIRAGSEAGEAKPTYAPVLSDGEIVEAAWARLAERAGLVTAAATTEDPDLHLTIGDTRIDPVSASDGVYTFKIDRGAMLMSAGAPHLRSRSAVPSLLGHSRHEHRQLGVALRQLVIEAEGMMICLDHRASALRVGGAHISEAGHCWTDGDLELPAGLFAHISGPLTLVVQTRSQGMRYQAQAAQVKPAQKKRSRKVA